MSKLYIDNLYRVIDDPEEDLFCLLIDKVQTHLVVSGFVPGVVYLTSAGEMKCVPKVDWDTKFVKVEEVSVADLTESQLKMIRRANPGDNDLDFIKVFEGWSESEANMTGHVIELAVGSAVVKLAAMMNWRLDERVNMPFELTIKTEDLQSFLQNYEVERVPMPHGFTFRIAKSFPK